MRTILLIIAAAVFFIPAAVMYTEKKNRAKEPSAAFRFAWLYIVLSLLYSAMLTPLNVPDELAHLNRTMAVSEIAVSRIPGTEAIRGNVPKGIADIKAFGDDEYRKEFWDLSKGQELVPIDKSVNHLMTTYTNYAYAVPAITVTVCRIAGFPYQLIIILGRLSNAVFYAVLAAVSIKLAPKLKWAIAAISFLPATVWLMNSFSYDSWNMALIILLIAFCVHCEGNEKFDFRHILAAGLILMIMMPVKYVYFVAGLYIFLMFPRYSDKKKRNRLIIGLGIIAVIGIAIMYVTHGGDIRYMILRPGVDARSGVSEDDAFTLARILKRPGYTFFVYIRTILQNGDSYLVNSMIGENYGAYVPSIVSSSMLLCCALLIFGGMKKDMVSIKEKRISFMFLFLGASLVMTSFLFSYSGFQGTQISMIGGLQGRYFLPLHIGLAFFPLSNYLKLEYRHKKMLLYALFALNVVSLLCRVKGLM